jgi:hypothetical protein
MSQPVSQSVSQPMPYKEANKCLFVTILSCMLPFYAPSTDGDTNLALAAIAEMIESCRAATPAEFDLAGRLLGYAAAAMQSLKRSMKPDLTDALILQYRRNAIALGRSAEQCRKLLEAMQTKREKQREQAAAASAMPAPRPAPVTPPRPSAPPRQMPPRQPHPPAQDAAAPSQAPAKPQASAQLETPGRPKVQPQAAAHAASAQPEPAAQPKPPAQPQADQPAAGPPSAYPNSTVEGDPEFTIDLEAMKHNALAMLADLQALAAEFAPETPDASIANIALPPIQPVQSRNAGMA